MIPKGKCKRCRSRHFCGVTEVISPDDKEQLKKYGVKLEVKVTECPDFKEHQDG